MTHLSPKKEQIRAQIASLVEAYAAEEFKETAFEPGATAIPPSGKLLGAQELKNLVDASLDAWLTTGRFNDTFEANLAAFLGVKHVMTTNSGSSANLLALAALTSSNLGDKALKPGDEVISVAAGFPTTVNPLLQYGLVPVFVDIDIPTYNIDPTAIEAAISDKTRAIMLAHTLGNPFDLETVMQLARKHDLWVIEDTCDALGSTYTPSTSLARHRGKDIAAHKPRLVGTFGDVATLSFYPAHHITMGEGGAVYTDDGKLKPIIESFRDWGRDCFCAPGRDNTCGKRFCWKLGDMPEGYDHKYIYSHAGYNMKITDMQAACGVAQLDRISDFVAARKANFAYLYNGLKCCEEFLILPEATPNSSPSWFGFTLTLRDSAPLSRIELLRKMEHHKIGTRLLFAGNITCQPYMAGRNFRVSGSLENTDLVMNNTFWVGVQPALTKDMLDYLIETIKGCFNVT